MFTVCLTPSPRRVRRALPGLLSRRWRALALTVSLTGVLLGSMAAAQAPEAQTPETIWQATPASTPATAPSSLPTSAHPEDTTPEITPVILSATLIKTQDLPLSLAQTLTAVEAQNLSLRSEQTGEKIQKARYYQALSEFLPDFDAFYTHRRFGGVIQIFGNQTLQIYQTSIEPGMTASLRVWPGGKTVFDALAAHRRVRASQSLVRETHQQQLAAAAAEYYTLLQAQLQRVFAQKSLDEAHEQTAITQARYEAGVGTRLEILQAQTVQARRERQLIDAQNAISLGEQALLNRLNLDPEVHITPDLADAFTHRLVPDAVTPERLIQSAMAAHPVLKRLHQQRQALKWQGRSILAEAIPSVDVNANVSYRGPAYDALGLTRFAGLSVQTTLGDRLGLAIPTRWLEAHRQIQQLQLQQQQAMRDIEAQVVSAFLDSQSAASAIEAVREERRAAEEGYRLAVGRYKAGVGIHLDVIAAESALSDARAQLVQAVADFNRAQIRLLQAAGLASRQALIDGVSADALPAP